MQRAVDAQLIPRRRAADGRIHAEVGLRFVARGERALDELVRAMCRQLVDLPAELVERDDPIRTHEHDELRPLVVGDRAVVVNVVALDEQLDLREPRRDELVALEHQRSRGTAVAVKYSGVATAAA